MANEAAIRHVAVESANDPVAVEPGPQPSLVLVVAVRVGIVNEIEPQARPAFAIARRREQAIDQLFPHGSPFSVRRIPRGDELVNLPRCRRQPVQIECEPANQRHRIRLRARRHCVRFERGKDEAVDDGLGPDRVLDDRNGGLDDRLQRPPRSGFVLIGLFT